MAEILLTQRNTLINQFIANFQQDFPDSEMFFSITGVHIQG